MGKRASLYMTKAIGDFLSNVVEKGGGLYAHSLEQKQKAAEKQTLDQILADITNGKAVKTMVPGGEVPGPWAPKDQGLYGPKTEAESTQGLPMGQTMTEVETKQPYSSDEMLQLMVDRGVVRTPDQARALLSGIITAAQTAEANVAKQKREDVVTTREETFKAGESQKGRESAEKIAGVRTESAEKINKLNNDTRKWLANFDVEFGNKSQKEKLQAKRDLLNSLKEELRVAAPMKKEAENTIMDTRLDENGNPSATEYPKWKEAKVRLTDIDSLQSLFIQVSHDVAALAKEDLGKPAVDSGSKETETTKKKVKVPSGKVKVWNEEIQDFELK